ncbi:MAG TPA: VOC family protein [Xanthomonadales bacterium]|nr:VOC family protein [Xanthomonadales bacterium]
MKQNLDHVLYATSNLEQGMDEIESLLGVRPARGGHHPQFGTHNALLSLGAGVYLEVIARDPDLPEPEGGAFVDVPDGAQSRLVTWVMQTSDIEQTVAAARAADIGIGKISVGRRENPDGSTVSWQATDPYAMPFDGALPFVINWGKTPHPSATTPAGGRFEQLLIEHPQAESVRSGLAVLGLNLEVSEAKEYRLVAKIRTPDGEVTLA